jgi:hypothetical protein
MRMGSTARFGGVPYSPHCIPRDRGRDALVTGSTMTPSTQSSTAPGRILKPAASTPDRCSAPELSLVAARRWGAGGGSGLVAVTDRALYAGRHGKPNSGNRDNDETPPANRSMSRLQLSKARALRTRGFRLIVFRIRNRPSHPTPCIRHHSRDCVLEYHLVTGNGFQDNYV